MEEECEPDGKSVKDKWRAYSALQKAVGHPFDFVINAIDEEVQELFCCREWWW